MGNEPIEEQGTEVAAVARRAAARLAGEIDRGLPEMVELVLEEGPSPEPTRSCDATAILGVASFLLAAAQFGWQIARDVKKDRREGAMKVAKAATGDGHQLRSAMIRRMRLRLEPPPGVSEGQRERLLEVAVEEILAEGRLADEE